MRETERVRIMERMRQKVRERKRRAICGVEDRFQRNMRRKGDMIEKMCLVALNPLHLTIFRLLYSNRVSIDPRGREFLIYAGHGINEALLLLISLGKLRDRIESKRMDALEGEISEAALELENVLDSHVSDMFLSLSETGDERPPFSFSLNLQGIEQHIDAFIEKVVKMEKLLNPWLQEEEEDDDGDVGEQESDILGLSNQSEVDVIRTLFTSWFPKDNSDHDDDCGGEESNIYGLIEVDVTRSGFISWFATKAASIFLGMKDDYIQDLQNLLPQKEEYGYSLRKLMDDVMIWWINKAADSIFVMEGYSTQQLVNAFPEDDVVVVSSGSESAVNMIGSTHLFCKIRDYLLQDFEKLKIVSIVGMVGIGKTALAKKIIQDPSISSEFDFCVFVRMGPEYEWRETMLAILAQVADGDKILFDDDVSLSLTVRKTLEGSKCLIVLDDFWNRGPRNIFEVFPSGSSRSVILFTTRILNTAYGGSIYEVPFLNNEESWDLLRGKIFGDKGCAPQLEKAGKKIAENCEGLPLLILAVAGLLSQAEKTPEYWSKVAANKTNSIFVDAYEKVSGAVYLSYYYLPQHLKACFLYVGAFPQNDDVHYTRLISLWSADGFLGVPYTFLQKHAYGLLGEIVSNNVALVTQWSTIGRRVKVLTLHSVFWYVCKREAQNEKFLIVMNSYTDASVQGIKNQRRLSFYKNILLCRKDVRESIASMSALHSVLCTGPYHQYEAPICLGKFRLLKVLDALTIRFYEFPKEVVKLAQLRYLALTCNGNLPSSISNLWGLQCLILHQHQSIKSSSVPHSYLPMEIWELLELEHLEIMGRNLPDPSPGTVLRKLLILLDMGSHTCTERVLASIPNLKKLRVQIELMPIATEPLMYFDAISHLKALRSLQFVIVNPEVKVAIVAPPASLVSFSKFIIKLTLSGFGYHWEDMHKIAELSNLQELKLKCYAFRGEKWEVKYREFWRLLHLSIEDTDLVHWTGNFQNLTVLTIKNCYRLLELPKISSAVEIRVVDCNPSAVTCAKQMATRYCRVYLGCSWLVR